MGKYDTLERFFANLGGDDVALGFDEIERVLGTPLPSSARQYASWWSSAQYYAVWARHGWRASPNLARNRVRFRRVRSATISEPEASRSHEMPRRSDPARRLLLLGCVKTKRTSPAPAKDLYSSALWQKRRTYAEASGQPWRILSAEHGLIHPDTVIEPYDRHLGSQTSGYRRSWSRKVADAVLDELRRLDLNAVEFHASTPYAGGVLHVLESAGIDVAWPFEGLRQGEHLAWYTDNSPRHPEGGHAPVVRGRVVEWPTLQSVERGGAFDYRWPDATEHFEHGWEGRVDFRGDSVRFQHAVGQRPVYGTERIHTVTFLDGAPVVEGVAADDFPRSQALLSLIKRPDGSMVRSSEELPSGYESFMVVDHRSEIDAPYSRYGLAVKIRTDDITTWVAHALLRRESRRERRPEVPQAMTAQPPGLDREDVLPVGPSEEPLHLERKRGIAERLLRFGETISETTPDTG